MYYKKDAWVGEQLARILKSFCEECLARANMVKKPRTELVRF